MDVSPEALAQFGPALESQVGYAAARLTPDQIRALAEQTMTQGRGKALRELWVQFFPEGSLTWPAAYEAYWRQRAAAGRLRLTAHEVMIEGLIHKTGRLAYDRHKATRSVYPSLHQYALFQHQPNNPNCAERDGLYWPIAERGVAWSMLLECSRPNCYCYVSEIREKDISMYKGLGKPLRPA